MRDIHLDDFGLDCFLSRYSSSRFCVFLSSNHVTQKLSEPYSLKEYLSDVTLLLNDKKMLNHILCTQYPKNLETWSETVELFNDYICLKLENVEVRNELWIQVILKWK